MDVQYIGAASGYNAETITCFGMENFVPGVGTERRLFEFVHGANIKKGFRVSGFQSFRVVFFLGIEH
jgi:hypothetical protein